MCALWFACVWNAVCVGLCYVCVCGRWIFSRNFIQHLSDWGFYFFLQIKALAGSKGQHTQWALSKVSSWAVSARSVQPGMFVLAPLFLDFTHIWL